MAGNVAVHIMYEELASDPDFFTSLN